MGTGRPRARLAEYGRWLQVQRVEPERCAPAPWAGSSWTDKWAPLTTVDAPRWPGNLGRYRGDSPTGPTLATGLYVLTRRETLLANIGAHARSETNSLAPAGPPHTTPSSLPRFEASRLSRAPRYPEDDALSYADMPPSQSSKNGRPPAAAV